MYVAGGRQGRNAPAAGFNSMQVGAPRAALGGGGCWEAAAGTVVGWEAGQWPLRGLVQGRHPPLPHPHTPAAGFPPADLRP